MAFKISFFKYKKSIRLYTHLTFIMKKYSDAIVSIPKKRYTSIVTTPKTAYIKRDENSDYVMVALSLVHPIVKVVTVNRFYEQTMAEVFQKLIHKIMALMSKKNMEPNPNEMDFDVCVNGKPLPHETVLSDVLQLEGEVKLKVMGVFYDVVLNSPWVNTMILPKIITTNMTIYPTKFNASCTTTENSKFEWFKNGNTIKGYHVAACKEWIPIGEGFFYTIKSNDIGHYIKLVCTPKSDKATGPPFVEVSLLPVETSQCNYYFHKTHLITNKPSGNNELRIVTYNILADMYVTTKEGRAMYEYCNDEALEKIMRLSNQCTEILGYNSDLICLQEVETSSFMNYLIPRLSEKNFSGLFNVKGNDTNEGTACFYRNDKFKLVKSSNYIYGKALTEDPHMIDVLSYMIEKEELFLKFKDLPHSLQLICLQPVNKSDHLLIIGNLHLYASGEACLIRCLQFISVICLFNSFKEDIQKMVPDKKISLILCGDFNSSPDSPIHEMINKGFINSNHYVWRIGPDHADGINFKVNLKMQSACGYPKYTNYTASFKSCLDYIYYETEYLEVGKMYPLPPNEVLSEHVGLPSVSFPSDHIPLIVDLKWKV